VEKSVSTSACPSIKELRDKISRWLHIAPEDQDLIDYALAVVRSNSMPDDPAWGLIIDASGGGKTELLRAFRGRKETYFLSRLTDRALMSGYRDPAHPNQDPSLLPELDGKVLIIKDLSPLLTMRRETRDAIIGQLRDAYDGFSDQGFGNVGRVSYEATFSLLAGSTPALEQFESVNQELGERFIKFRVHSADSRAKVRRAISHVGRDDGMRDEIKAAIGDFLDSLPTNGPSSVVPDEYLAPLTDLSDFTAIARSNVARDRNHKLLCKPKPEIGTRLGKELAKLFLSLADVRGKAEPDYEELRTVVRVAEDCIPPNRMAALGCLRTCYFLEEPAHTADIVKRSGLPESTVKQTLDDLHVLGLVHQEMEPPKGDVEVSRWDIREWGDKLNYTWALADVLPA
jgi:hypothetical protein